MLMKINNIVYYRLTTSQYGTPRNLTLYRKYVGNLLKDVRHANGLHASATKSLRN
jgi:hypothetical protein